MRLTWTLSETKQIKAIIDLLRGMLTTWIYRGPGKRNVKIDVSMHFIEGEAHKPN